MPAFQTQIYDVYNSDQVEVLTFNENANRQWLSDYALDTSFFKDVVLTYPMLFDEMDGTIGSTFEAYESGSLLPSIFLIDQTGTIVIRSDGIAINPAFEEEMEHILTTIDDLLANPPGGF